MSVLERTGDFPSPTILVDGVDVMPQASGSPTTQACRVDLPTAERVETALRRGVPVSTLPDAYPHELSVGMTCSRMASVSPAAGTVHKAILRAFAATDRVPNPGNAGRAGARQL